MKKYFVVVAVILSLTAQVALATEGVFENNFGDLNNAIVVIVGAGDDNTVNICSRELIEYKAVIIPETDRAIVTTVAILSSEVVKPGDRFDISSEVGCDEQHVVTVLTRILVPNPQSNWEYHRGGEGFSLFVFALC